MRASDAPPIECVGFRIRSCRRTPPSHLYYESDPGFVHLVGDELRRVLAAVR